MARYTRAPSPSLLAMLAPGALLSPLLTGLRVGRHALDVHFRENDKVSAYVGLTSVVNARLASGRVTVDSEYRHQPGGAALFRDWHPGESNFAGALEPFLSTVTIHPRWTDKEGGVQAAWAAVREPWVPIDREAVIGYGDTAHQTMARQFPAVAAAMAEVERLPRDREWAQLPRGKTSAELDQIAIDPQGRLVLLELKDATDSSVYYAPLQLLQYVHEWAGAWADIQDQVGELVAARVAVGLSPRHTPSFRAGFRPVIAFGRDTRSQEVRERYERVLGVVNRHLPRGVLPIETWCLDGGVPSRVT